MQASILNAFVAAAQEVLRTEAAWHVIPGPTHLLPQVYITTDVTLLIRVAGDLTGYVGYSLAEPSALHLVRQLVGKSEATLDVLARSSLVELSNVITGLAVFKLARQGYRLTLTPPALFMGQGLALAVLTPPRLFIALASEAGELGLHLALRPAC